MYPLDRRIVAQRIYCLLGSLRKTSYLLNVHFSTISRWINNPERKQYTKRKNLKTDIVIECIKTTIQTNPFMSIRKLVCIINKSLNVQISRELVRVILKKLNFTRKKAKPTFVPKLYPEKVKMFYHCFAMLLKKELMRFLSVSFTCQEPS